MKRILLMAIGLFVSLCASVARATEGQLWACGPSNAPYSVCSVNQPNSSCTPLMGTWTQGAPCRVDNFAQTGQFINDDILDKEQPPIDQPTKNEAVR